MTFGNDNNDKEMLEGCVGVAMGNALPEIKEAARYVTGSNREDGVARFLEKHVLQKEGV
ncbi:MAG: HAD hydrolase family protein, partial [Ileibacterium sp.]|nr:HAD hydrolase family protein [Ileibacterium sp.]